jgi:hypothetical protein
MSPSGSEKNIIPIKKYWVQISQSTFYYKKKAQNLSLDFGLLQFILLMNSYFIYFNLVVSTLLGVSFPLTIVDELIAMALIISVMLFISKVPISSLVL